MSKFFKVLGIIFIILLLLVFMFLSRYRKMKITYTEAFKVVEAINMDEINDGDYIGQFGDFLAFVKLKVTVQEHEITDIKILEQRSGKGYEATDTLKNIIDSQSPKVDIISGATGSSTGIMIAVYKALKGETTSN